MIRAVNVAKTFRGSAFAHRGAVEAVRGVSLALEDGRTYALVGESGSGKTTLTHLMIGLLTPDSGSVVMDGRTMTAYPARERFRAIQLVLQDGKSALDPRVSVGRSVAEPMINLGICAKKEAMRRAALLLRAVDMPEAAFCRKPAELSGGEQKRVCIARALSVQPKCIIFDETTAGLDVVRRRQVLDLVRNLQRERRFTALFVTHDLQVARYMADTLWVMKDGEIVDTLARPFASQHMHPYTALLMSAADPMVTAPQGA